MVTVSRVVSVRSTGPLASERRSFGDLSVEHGDRGGAVVVVVKAGVVTGHPADEVNLDVVVTVEELVGALVGVVADSRLPGVGLVGPGLEVLFEIGEGELGHAETSPAAGTQV